MTHISSFERISQGWSRAAMAGVAALALLMVAASLWAAPGIAGWFGAALGVIALAIAVIDARRFIIPNELTALGLILALANAAVLAPDGMAAAVLMAGLRAAVVAGLFLALRILYRRVRGRDGLGLGDVKLAGVLGAWLGWMTIPIAIEVAALAALAVYAIRHYRGGRAYDAALKFPFGLFLAPSIWIGWLFEALVLSPF